jgi:succinyl-CoA synthetase beta subunit
VNPINLHEYQAKDVFRSYGIPVPSGRVAASADEAVAAAEAIGGPVWVVKAQVHAGGRGKAGGVKVARDLDSVRVAAKGMLGKALVTKQTGGSAGRQRLRGVRVGYRSRDLSLAHAIGRRGAG